ncbi:hypothetical protein UA32_17370 [Photobacterium angustum]|uniref:GGDEF domain-containing protein n=1 Tax=Photobacterium angustum TaxID=661 RepID=A0ABX5H5Y4_PHOAN|nr:diguanylate cyclase [Photobacterium angustum]KJG36191.1 hypothetical protein UA32_17370 [Photobacterium angustum]PSX10913.1 hypothetical protein C0W27_09790 [Photobacterium angustum]
MPTFTIRSFITRFNYQLFDVLYGMRVHYRWLVLLVLALLSLIVFNITNGTIKSYELINWLDVVGEGSSAIMVFVWLVVILSTRSPGKITNYFAMGFTCIFLALTQDVIDEFIRLKNYTMIGNTMEYMILGLTIVTYAFCLWRKELTVVKNYLMQRQQLNARTPLHPENYRLPELSYLHSVLTAQYTESTKQNNSYLIVINLQNSYQLLPQLSPQEAERLRVSISELLLIASRHNDLVCQVAGHHYLMLLDGLNKKDAVIYSRYVEQLLSAYQFYLDSNINIEMQWQIGIVEVKQSTYSLQSLYKQIDEAINLSTKPQVYKGSA